MNMSINFCWDSQLATEKWSGHRGYGSTDTVSPIHLSNDFLWYTSDKVKPIRSYITFKRFQIQKKYGE